MKCYVIVFLSLFLLVGCEGESDMAFTPLQVISADGTAHNFQVELAITPKRQAQGLMHRTSMPAKQGMLFWFGGSEAPRSFWMKNTLIPLDMIFIRANGTIHHIHHSAQPEDLTSVHSQGPVAAVLELNGGVSKLLGLRKGDTVHHALFGAKHVE